MSQQILFLRKLLGEQKLDAIFISYLPNIIYFTRFPGFTTIDRDAYLLVTKKNHYIFTHGIYQEAVRQFVSDFTLVPIKRENPIGKAIKTIIGKEKIKKLGYEPFDLKVTEYNRLIAEIDKKILVESNSVSTLRVKKTDSEIQSIKKACELGDKAFIQIVKKIKLGITEKEVAFELDFYIKKNGADISFDTIVAFGPNASKPHHVPTDKKLKQNELVLIDFGVKLDDYCSDMTRTFFFGETNIKQKKVYETVLTAQQKAIEFIKNKLSKHETISAKMVDKIARDFIISQSYPSIPHSLGHGIGLEVHEAPRLTPVSEENLEEGMVFSLEPGIYLPGEFGVRIEDLFAITNGKLVQLTNAPKNL